MDRFKSIDLHVMSKPDLTPVTDADQAVEDGIRRTLVAGAVSRRHHRRGDGLDRPQPAPVGDRPHRRHQELRPGRPGLGDADLAGRGRGGRPRRGLRPQLQRRWWASKGHGAWTGRSLLKATGARCPTYAGSRTPRCPTPRCPAGTSAGGSTTSSRCPGAAGGRGRTATSVLHAARRGCRGPGGRARPRGVRHGRARRDRPGGRGRFTSLDGTDGPFGGNALASNGHLHEAALSFLGSLPTTRTTPTRSRGAPARCTSCGAGGQIHRPGGETHAGVEKFHDTSMSFSTPACWVMPRCRPLGASICTTTCTRQ